MLWHVLVSLVLRSFKFIFRGIIAKLLLVRGQLPFVSVSAQVVGKILFGVSGKDSIRSAAAFRIE